MLDRTDVEVLVSTPFVETTWASGINQRGQPVAKPEKEPTADATLVSPGSNGATNWMSPSFSPDAGLFYVSARRIFSIFYRTVIGKSHL